MYKLMFNRVSTILTGILNNDIHEESGGYHETRSCAGVVRKLAESRPYHTGMIKSKIHFERYPDRFTFFIHNICHNNVY